MLQTERSVEEMPDLGRVGLDFPAGYELCGELPLPFPWAEGLLRIWKPLGRTEHSSPAPTAVDQGYHYDSESRLEAAP